jgi:hypothetical protein
MKQNEIIEMARQAANSCGHTIKATPEIVETLEAFAKLVAAKEREACAKVTENAWMAFHHASISHDALNPFPELKFAAAAIRARGEA